MTTKVSKDSRISWWNSNAITFIVENKVMQLSSAVFIACGTYGVYKKCWNYVALSSVGGITTFVLYRNLQRGFLVDIVKSLKEQLAKEKEQSETHINALKDHMKKFAGLSEEELKQRKVLLTELEGHVAELKEKIAKLESVKEQLQKVVDKLEEEQKNLSSVANSEPFKTVTKRPGGLLLMLQASLDKLAEDNEVELAIKTIQKRINDNNSEEK